MAWLRERAWQQTIAILLVLVGAVLIYRGAAGTGALDGTALAGVALFAIGLVAPLISQALHAYDENTAESEDV